jgi:hypothetical protein
MVQHDALEAAYGAVKPLKTPVDFSALIREAKEEYARRSFPQVTDRRPPTVGRGTVR